MCNVILFKFFFAACISMSSPEVSAYNCIKAFDICVDRQMWEMEESVSKPSVREQYEGALQICDDELFNRKEFSKYYTDTRCEWGK